MSPAEHLSIGFGTWFHQMENSMGNWLTQSWMVTVIIGSFFLRNGWQLYEVFADEISPIDSPTTTGLWKGQGVELNPSNTWVCSWDVFPDQMHEMHHPFRRIFVGGSRGRSPGVGVTLQQNSTVGIGFLILGYLGQIRSKSEPNLNLPVLHSSISKKLHCQWWKGLQGFSG